MRILIGKYKIIIDKEFDYLQYLNWKLINTIFGKRGHCLCNFHMECRICYDLAWGDERDLL